MHAATGRVGDSRQGPPRADARLSPLAFRVLTQPFAETLIVPASVGRYTLRNQGTGPCKVVKAFVR